MAMMGESTWQFSGASTQDSLEEMVQILSTTAEPATRRRAVRMVTLADASPSHRKGEGLRARFVESTVEGVRVELEVPVVTGDPYLVVIHFEEGTQEGRMAVCSSCRMWDALRFDAELRFLALG